MSTMNQLQDTFKRARLDAMSAYRKLFCESFREDNPDITVGESSVLHQEYQRAWQAYKNADVALFEYEAEHG